MRLRVLARRPGVEGDFEYLTKQWGKPESEEVWHPREVLAAAGYDKAMGKVDAAEEKRATPRRRRGVSRSQSRPRTRGRPAARRRIPADSESEADSNSPSPPPRRSVRKPAAATTRGRSVTRSPRRRRAAVAAPSPSSSRSPAPAPAPAPAAATVTAAAPAPAPAKRRRSPPTSLSPSPRASVAAVPLPTPVLTPAPAAHTGPVIDLHQTSFVMFVLVPACSLVLTLDDDLMVQTARLLLEVVSFAYLASTVLRVRLSEVTLTAERVRFFLLFLLWSACGGLLHHIASSDFFQVSPDQLRVLDAMASVAAAMQAVAMAGAVSVGAGKSLRWLGAVVLLEAVRNDKSTVLPAVAGVWHALPVPLSLEMLQAVLHLVCAASAAYGLWRALSFFTAEPPADRVTTVLGVAAAACMLPTVRLVVQSFLPIASQQFLSTWLPAVFLAATM